MSKNILIFSDGTGQFGGLKPDQRLSNIYKLYRASRPGADSEINPSNQVAFYDAGLGTGESGANWAQKISRIFGAAFGTGISDNIADCYEAIIKAYEPGDRVYLFGFSRGAYTARCVANVMNLCGVPSRMPDGSPVPRGGRAVRELAEEAVFEIYEHGSGHPREKYEAEREEKARRFRARHDCCGEGLDGEEQGNVAPYFVGVFDTVASLGAGRALSIIVVGLLTFVLLVALAAFIWKSALLTAAFAIPVLWIGYKLLMTRLRQRKVIKDWPKQGDKQVHYAVWRMKNYDRFLDTNVSYARHARAIDENRKHFPVAGWAYSHDVQRMDGLDPPWLRQVWFAGNHSDIGGSHPEEESRLSDIALEWMVEQLDELEHPILLDRHRLRLWPDPAGMQHDARKALAEAGWQQWLPANLRITWPEGLRSVHPEADLHPSVVERLASHPVVQHDESRSYRPVQLREHHLARGYFPENEGRNEQGEPEA
ncbi:DUF2235 domain-containing protein [Erythrobacter litoralis]|uniref:DUF2235 domain-containing protein n=1 Tax=Erythrobacter litoralis TaxID=39960 RepID=UPI002435CA35|nr:DUF2235 domain-containing protein [Erythrobacter litoralis]MDG6079035.1 DUF2235 domain-containing protein [Erythrobacter litoralis]